MSLELGERSPHKKRNFRVPLLGPHQEFHPLYFQFPPKFFQACTSSFFLFWRGRRGCLLGGFWRRLGDFFLLSVLSTVGHRKGSADAGASHSFQVTHLGAILCQAGQV